MITKTMDKEAVIAYLQQDLYVNLNVLGHLNNNADSDIYIYNERLENGVIISGGEHTDRMTRFTPFAGILRLLIVRASALIANLPHGVLYIRRTVQWVRSTQKSNTEAWAWLVL